MVAIILILFYFQHRDEAAFHRLFRRHIFWWAAAGTPFFMFLRASQEIYWYDTLTWRPVIEGLMWGATTKMSTYSMLNFVKATAESSTHTRYTRRTPIIISSSKTG